MRPKRRRASIVTAVLTGLVFATASASRGAPDTAGPLTLAAWVELDGAAEATALAAVSAHALDEVDLFNFGVEASGGLAESALAEERPFVKKVHAQGGTVAITFVDFVGGARTVIASSALRQRFAANAARACVEDGIDAVDLDFEKVILEKGERASFVALCRALATALHAAGKRLEVTIPGAEKGDATYPGLDFAAIGEVADTVKVMTYDEHGSWSAPGPVGGLDWAKRVVAATEERGIPAAKLFLGVALYGRKWPGGKALTVDEAEAMARREGVTPTFDAKTGEEHWKAGGTTVYYTDEKALSAHVDLARTLGLAGAALFEVPELRRGFIDALAAEHAKDRATPASVPETKGLVGALATP
jgi:spore germination protein YaaH